MSSPLVIHNRFAYDVYMEDIANIKCRLQHLRLELYFILQNMIKVVDIYVSTTITNTNNWFVI